MSTSFDMLQKLQLQLQLRKQGPENAPHDPQLAPPSKALTPVALEALDLAVEPGLIVQHMPANQPSIYAQPSPQAQRRMEQAEALTDDLQNMLNAGPSFTPTLTPEVREKVGLWLDKVDIIFSSTPLLEENLRLRHQNHDLDPNNTVDRLAELRYDWRDTLDAQAELDAQKQHNASPAA
jgi:hypothetical protein